MYNNFSYYEMRGRKPKYATEEERNEARRLASQRYRDKRASQLDEAKKRIAELEAEIRLLKGEIEDPAPEEEDLPDTK